MTLVMAYVILISAVVAAGAVVIEAVARVRGGTRWVWVFAMVLAIGATIFAMVAPQDQPAGVAAERAATTTNVLTLVEMGVPLAASLHSAGPAQVVIAATDSILPVAWLLATLVLLAALGLGQRRFRLERRKARAATIGGHDVLMTDNLGPAVAGVRRPVVFVPRWVMALDGGSQQLLLAHEIEHVKRRDTSLLLIGALTAAITPWNPVVWWMVRRLRLAVEQDCDARVLAAHPGIRRYADLLLMAASRHGLTTRLLAAHFGEYTSDLVRRIEAMTSRNSLPWRSIAAGSLVAASLGAAACEAPRPDPVAPLPVRQAPAMEQEVPASTVRSREFSSQVARCTSNAAPGCQISVIVQSSAGKLLRMYFGEIPVAHLPEAGIAKVNVENAECGDGTCSLIWITLKPDASLSKDRPRAEAFLPVPATILERRRDAVEPKRLRGTADFTEIRKPLLRSDGPDTAVLEKRIVAGGLVPARLIEREVERVSEGTGFGASERPRVLLRSEDRLPQDPPNVILYGSNGTELKRIAADQFRAGTRSPLDEIRQDDIEAIEVMKGQRGCAPLGCPLVHIWLKPGRDAAYRKK